MKISNKNIDHGRSFDWGEISDDYAKYRDIYPEIFYQKIVEHGLCAEGQKILDLGTGTGVLPRNMYRFGAHWTAADIAENQIAQAKKLSAKAGQNIQYLTASAEELDFPDHTFDVITACQCFWYFDHEKLMPKLRRMLKSNGSLLLLYMAWLPYEDPIAGASEALILKYNPKWTGAGETKKPICVPNCVYDHFEAAYHEEYDVEIPFTADTWHGRMKACRGIGASLPQEEIVKWESEHKQLLRQLASNQSESGRFFIKHYAAMLELFPKPSRYASN